MSNDNLINYAKKIAVYQHYPRLENGLQPLGTYTLDGREYKGLMDKYTDECVAIRNVYASWQSGSGRATEWHVLAKAANICYYTTQIEKQTGQSAWPVAYHGLKIYLPYDWGEREVEAAADTIYAWRSATPDNKDTDYEIDLVKERISVLPSSERRSPGRPVTLHSQVTFNIRTLSAEAAQYIDDTRGEQTRRARLDEIILAYKKLTGKGLTN